MPPTDIKTIKTIITIIVSVDYPNPIAELIIKVVKNVKNNELPFSIPVT